MIHRSQCSEPKVTVRWAPISVCREEICPQQHIRNLAFQCANKVAKNAEGKKKKKTKKKKKKNEWEQPSVLGRTHTRFISAQIQLFPYNNNNINPEFKGFWYGFRSFFFCQWGWSLCFFCNRFSHSLPPPQGTLFYFLSFRCFFPLSLDSSLGCVF